MVDFLSFEKYTILDVNHAKKRQKKYFRERERNVDVIIMKLCTIFYIRKQPHNSIFEHTSLILFPSLSLSRLLF
jgi:hypothetical protein